MRNLFALAGPRVANKMSFFLKLSHSKVRAFFYLPRQGRAFLVDAYPAWDVSYIFRYMFAYV